MKSWLILAQILGIFPTSGLWGEDSVMNLKSRKCSFPMIYSWITWFIRFILKFLFLLGTYLSTLSKSKSKEHATGVGLGCAFCTGVGFQIVSIYNTKEFIRLIQNVEKYDATYPMAKGKKRKWLQFLLSPFFIFNFVFIFASIAFPVVYLISILERIASNPLMRILLFQDKYDEIWYGALAASTIVLVFTESATIYPIIQITYYIQKLEERLQEIKNKISNYLETKAKIQPEEIYLLKVYKSSEKEAHQKLCGYLTNKEFWGKLNRQYLDYSRISLSFQDFVGIYFVLALPVQILAIVGLIYLDVITNVYEQQRFVDHSFRIVVVASLARIWGWCNVCHKLGSIHGNILEDSLRVEQSQIFSDEKLQYQKFLKAVKYLPIQINACGYFNITRGCVPSVISATMSYIIVLLQFRDAERNNEDINFWGDVLQFLTSSNATGFNNALRVMHIVPSEPPKV